MRNGNTGHAATQAGQAASESSSSTETWGPSDDCTNSLNNSVTPIFHHRDRWGEEATLNRVTRCYPSSFISLSHSGGDPPFHIGGCIDRGHGRVGLLRCQIDDEAELVAERVLHDGPVENGCLIAM